VITPFVAFVFLSQTESAFGGEEPVAKANISAKLRTLMWTALRGTRRDKRTLVPEVIAYC